MCKVVYTTDQNAALRPATKAVHDVKNFKHELGPFVVAVDTTRMPMVFTDARSEQNEIIYANRSFLELTQFDMAEAIGLPFKRLVVEASHPKAELDQIASEKRSSAELRCLKKDGTEYDACVVVSPVLDEDDQLQQYSVSLIDLTEHIEKRVQAYLEDAEIYRYAPGFIAFTEGPDHRFKFANTAYETLIGRTDLIGRSVADVLPELADQGVLGTLDHVYRTGKRLIGKALPILLKRGSNGETETRHLDFVYEPVTDPNGMVVGLFCEGSDVTDGRITSGKLDDIQNQLMHGARTNAMGTMAATLAHELNQPLAAIANYAAGCSHLLEQGIISEDKLREALIEITSASERAGTIIRTLREMTKRSLPTFELFDLGVALEEAVHLVQVGGCADVSISMTCAPFVNVLGNKIQVQQVLVNLLRNACEAAATSGRPGKVLAAAKNKDGNPCILICDNGPGLPARMEDDIFAWHESTKDEGMGIGLSISRTIVEGHGGRIAIDKTGPSGTSISFTLPNPPSD